MTWRTALIAAVVLAAALVVGGLTAHGQKPQPVADTNQTSAAAADQAFLSALHQQNIPVADEQKTLAQGREVCADFDRVPVASVMLANMVRETGLPIDQAGWMAGSAVAVYCPSHVAEVQRQAADMANQAAGG